jgi:hypothetical protein
VNRFWINFGAYRRMCAGRSADERRHLRAVLRAGPISAPLPFLEAFLQRLDASDIDLDALLKAGGAE